MKTDLHNLLRLKRYEHPSPDYFERFLDEFHDRQRSAVIRQPFWSLLWERAVDTFPDFRVPRLAYAGVAALAVVFSTVIMVSQQDGPGPSSSLALNNPSPMVNILPTGYGDIRFPVSSRSDFPPHYVLEARPVSYESPYSF
jgi:hypothetical protein